MQPQNDDPWVALMQAVRADDASAIAALEKAGALEGVLGAHLPDDVQHRTPLMLAYWLGKPLAAKALVNAGADYQQKDACGNDASWYARRFGRGQQEEHMGDLIEARVRRISMEKVIGQDAPSESAGSVQKSRRSDV